MYYVVKRGKNPGIYNSWEECKEQVNEFSKPIFKKFSNYKIARSYFDNEPYKINKMNKYFNITTEKKKTTTFKENNYMNTKNKDITYYFNTNEEQTYNKNDEISNIKTINLSESNISDNYVKESNNSNNDIKIIKINNTEVKDTSVNLNKNTIIVYTDGSCLNNGKKNAKGGIGVWFGYNDTRNISQKLIAEKPTNQLAELTAILKTIELLYSELNNHKLLIYTDSDYSIKCITRYCKNWVNNNWKKKDGTNVKNKEVIKKIYNYYIKFNINFIHVKAHTNNNDKHSFGNSMADKLAVAGSSI